MEGGGNWQDKVAVDVDMVWTWVVSEYEFISTTTVNKYIQVFLFHKKTKSNVKFVEFVVFKHKIIKLKLTSGHMASAVADFT